MNYPRSNLTRAVVALFAWGTAAVASAQPRYDFILVDSFNANPLAGETFLWDINDDGTACGITTIDNVMGYPGIVWDEINGKTRVPVASPQSLSNQGLLVGIGDILDLPSGQLFATPPLPGTYRSPQFGGVNDSGVAVGTISGCSCSDSGGVTNVPYLWDSVNGARTLPTPVPNARGLSRINNAGVAIGWLNGWVLNDAFFVDTITGAYTFLNDVFPADLGFGPTRAFDINDHGAIVGTRYGTHPIQMYGYVYSPTDGLRILPFPGAGYQQYVRPLGINNAGTIVGQITTTQASERAFVYWPDDGILNLNNASLVAGIPTGYILVSAQKISEPGWIVGHGRTAGGKITGFVLKPTGCTPDYNGDGVPDQTDVGCLVLAVAGDFTCAVHDPDFNRDGVADQADIAALIQVVAGGPCP